MQRLMSPRVPTAYPWNALESVTRAGARRAARARRQVQAVLDIARIGHALADLSDSDVSLVVRRVSSEPPRRRPTAELGFELGASGVVCALSIEPELAANLLARVLRRPVTLSSPAILDDSLAGAFSAILLEVARRSNAQGALHVLDSSEALTRARDVFLEVTAVVGGTPFQVVVGLGLAELDENPRVPLAALGELEIALPLVIGLGLAERAALADFSPGNAWFPGGGWWLDANGEGRIALAAATQDQGIVGMLSRDGKIVIRGESVALPFDVAAALPESPRDELMSDSEKSDPSRLSDAVLESPVVVRVEMGAVSMTAREWAELGPGDVIETGRRIAEPVILRVAGREVARGELVNLEGELGVRIRELVRS
jgi:flagellar motor switch/type III secretory pathway protein FliN